MLRIALTGGIGSGKSTVAECFARLGVPIVDTDVIARDLTAPGSSALAEIRAVFGESVLRADGALDRAALRQRVFNDVDARHRLEAILHPRIRIDVERALAVLDAAPYVLIVIPLFVETGGYRDLVDRVLVVDCDVEMQIARVMARNGFTRAEATAILEAQATRQDRLAAADDVITNTASREQLCEQVAALHRRYQAMQRPRSP